MGSLCQLNRVPFDVELLRQRYAGPHSVLQLIEAANALGFRTGELRLGRRGLKDVRFPCIAFAKAGTDDGRAPASPQTKPALLIAAGDDRLLYFAADSASPSSINTSAFLERFEPYLLLVRFEAANDAEAGQEGEAASGSIGGRFGGRFGSRFGSRFGYGWFWRELMKYRRVWRDVVLGSLFIQLIALATPLFTQVVIDKVVVHQTESTLAVIALCLAVFMLFTAGMSWLRQYMVLHTGNRVDAVLGSEVFRHLMRLHLPYFEQRSTGVVVARLHAVETIREFMAGAAVSVILDFPFLIVFLAVMFFYSWQLTLIAVAILALIAVISAAVTPVFRRRLNQQFLLGARNQAFLTEYVVGIETVKSLQMESRLESRYDDYLASYLASSFATRQVSNTYNVVANALEQAMTLGILVAGALLVMRNDGFTIGMLVAFQMFASRLSQPVLRLAGLWQEFQQANIAMKRLGDIMDAPCEPFALTPSRTAEGKGEIEIKDLSFRYSAESPYLFQNLSTILRPGKLTVITGPSGSGKSTLAKLLLGFYQAEGGQILVDGKDVRHFSANELRGLFGVVPQETMLFSGTVYENLIAANPNAGFDDAVAACKAAEIHDVIEKLPKGYNTLIGEHGVGLSGGQKQRLAIARAVLKKPKVLIFDEATSGLDAETEERFAKTVNQIRGQTTILFIAHQVPKGLEVDEVFGLAGDHGQSVR